MFVFPPRLERAVCDFFDPQQTILSPLRAKVLQERPVSLRFSSRDRYTGSYHNQHAGTLRITLYGACGTEVYQLRPNVGVGFDTIASHRVPSGVKIPSVVNAGKLQLKEGQTVVDALCDLGGRAAEVFYALAVYCDGDGAAYKAVVYRVSSHEDEVCFILHIKREREEFHRFLARLKFHGCFDPL